MKPTPSRSLAGSSSSSAPRRSHEYWLCSETNDHRRGEVGRADRAHRPLLDELVQSLERVGERRDAVRAVVLVEVDPVGLEAAERRLDRLADVGPRAAGGLAVAEVVAELRRQHDLVAPAGEGAADDLLAAAAVAVDVGGVEEGDAGVDRRVDHRARLRLVDPAAEVVAAEPHDRHLEDGAAQAARAHPGTLVGR
jgi:hypothetical protein